MAEPAALARPRYIGIISALDSVIHSVSDADSIARRLLFAVDGYCFVTRCFSVQAEAVCLLTDPWRAGAVIDSDKVVSTSESAGCGTDRVWLACLTKSSRSCVELNRAGVQSVLPSFSNPAVGTCILVRFCTVAAAWSWLASGSTRSLLEVMNADASIETSKELGNATAAPR